MSVEKWVTLGTKHCEKVNEEVELMEKRIYPTGIQDSNSSGENYRVLLRKCSAGYQCGHMENPCVWAEEGHDGRLYIR